MKNFIKKLIANLEKCVMETLSVNENQFETNKKEYYSYSAISLCEVREIANQLAEEYTGGWIPCTIIEHPEHGNACEVTIRDKTGIRREIAYYSDVWRREADEQCLDVIAWKEPSAPFNPVERYAQESISLYKEANDNLMSCINADDVCNKINELEKKYTIEYGCKVIEMYADIVSELKKWLGDIGISTRMITLSDGTSMGNSVFVFKTNAPVEELQELERVSCNIYSNGRDEEDVPIWSNVLKEKGYIFNYLDEYQHVTAFGTSEEWLARKYSCITEHYRIENQP